MDVKIILKIHLQQKQASGFFIPSGFSMSTIPSFRSAENKHDVYRGKGYMKKFCEFLREQTMKITNFTKKK